MKIPTRVAGDAHARAQIRMEEIRKSIAIVLEAVESLPGGPVSAEIGEHARAPRGSAGAKVPEDRSTIACTSMKRAGSGGSR